MYFSCGGLVTQTLYYVVNGITTVMTGSENNEVRRVIPWSAVVGDVRGNVKGLPVHMGVSSDNCQYKRVVDHDDVDIVRVLSDSVLVGDGERDEVEPVVSYESRWDVRCEDVTSVPISTANVTGSDGGTIRVATEGCFVTLGY